MGARSGIVFAHGLTLVAVGCGFPSVDYAVTTQDASMPPADGGVCALPQTSVCVQDAATCVNVAAQTRNACNKHCTDSSGTDPTCKSQCDTSYQSAHDLCVAACEQCAASLCGGQPTNCSALAGS